MALGQNEVRDLIGDQLFVAYKEERSRLDRIDSWWRWDHDKPHSPRASTKEYKELSARAQTPWLGLVVTSVAQSMYVEGYRHTGEGDNVEAWSAWQANGMDRRQIAIHRAALGYGYSFLSVLPGQDPLTGASMPAMRGISPRRMSAFYIDPASDDWPTYAMHAEPAKINGEPGYVLKVYDDELVWRFHSNANGDVLTYIEYEEHGVGVCPIVRFTNMLDLEGRQDGEVEPFIPVAGRIDQTTFDRLVVQRFSSWVVRTVTGMSPPEQLTDETDDEYRTRTKLRLAVEDILIADDPDTKFGSLPATALGGFIDAADADIRVLAAVTQTPPHHLLGQIANLSAEALAAAEASLTRKVEERKHSFGESWEQALRLSSWVSGNTEAASDTDAQVRWRDMESRSLAQAADALGKLAQMLQVPVEMLWEKIPGFTDQDVERAKALAEQGGGIDALIRELSNGATAPAFGQT